MTAAGESMEEEADETGERAEEVAEAGERGPPISRPAMKEAWSLAITRERMASSRSFWTLTI